MKKELLFDEINNSRVWEIETLEDIHDVIYTMNPQDTCYYKNYTFKIERVNNDVYGNPMYKFQLFKDFTSINESLKGLVTRCYKTKGYSLIQSYNISQDIEYIFNKIEK